MNHLTFAPDLIEEAVLLAEHAVMRRRDARAFRQDRDRLYGVTNDRERESGFRTLHLKYFSDLGLGTIVADVLRERCEVTSRVEGCRVVRAFGGRDEGADLADILAGGRDVFTLVLRLCPATLVGLPERLSALLHHELTHVADMLDPAFGYRRELPPSSDGPSADNILRDRYRVLWDTTIDGRMARAGRAPATAWESRWREFALTFGMLDDDCRAAFRRWFAEDRPRHEDFLAFATAPGGAGARNSGRCPICRFPVFALDPRAGTMSDAVADAIRADQPQWRVGEGLCSQCFDLYEARYEERHAATH